MRNENTQIIIAPKDSIDAATRKMIADRGFILIETDNWDKVKIIAPTSNVIGTDDLLMSAMLAANENSYSQQRFALELLQRMSLNEKESKAK